MLNPGAHNCVEYIFQKSFRNSNKIDVTVKIFMTQSWEEKFCISVWKDQDSFKVMEMMALGYIFYPSVCLFLKSSIAQSISVLR